MPRALWRSKLWRRKVLLLLRICCCRGALLSACRALSAAHRLPRAARRHLHNSHAVSAVSAPAARLCLAGTGIPLPGNAVSTRRGPRSAAATSCAFRPSRMASRRRRDRIADACTIGMMHSLRPLARVRFLQRSRSSAAGRHSRLPLKRVTRATLRDGDTNGHAVVLARM